MSKAKTQQTRSTAATRSLEQRGAAAVRAGEVLRGIVPATRTPTAQLRELGPDEPIEAVINTDDIDSYGTIVSPAGVILDRFEKNPVVQWAHGYDADQGTMPVGRVVEIEVGESAIVARVEFDQESERGAELDRLYRQRKLRGFSIGFIPRDAVVEMHDEREVLVYTRWELVELSACTVPSNPNALARAIAPGAPSSRSVVSTNPGPRSPAASIKRRESVMAKEKIDYDSFDEVELGSFVRGLEPERLGRLLSGPQIETLSKALQVNRRYLAPVLGAMGGHGGDASGGTGGDDDPALERAVFGRQAGKLDVRGLMGEYFRAIIRAPGGLASHYCGDDAMLRRTLSSTDNAGGYLIPPGFIAEIVRDEVGVNDLFSQVRKVPVGIPTGELPKVGTNASVSWGSENTDIDEGDPAFGTITFSVNRLNSLIKMSREVAADSSPSLVDFIVSQFREAIAEERDRVIAIGTGSGQPLGLYSASGITDVAVTSLTYDNLVTLHETPDERYMADPSMRWVFNQRVKSACLKLTDDNGQPLLQRDLTSGFQYRLLGHPVTISNHCPNNFIFFGAMRYYLWFDRQEMGVERTIEGGDAFRKHQLWLKVFERVDGKPCLPPTVPMVRTRVLAGVS